ncbi:acyltransferase [Microbacteriaceae bacterium VKM Ac-2855]|nr:acyltransferase [Microbacteriaceae bacterium VKM Ac-2855]
MKSPRRRSRTAPAAPAAKNIRLDIQGLRAIAVSVVILDHLMGYPTGGFVGVDIFFVLSGFLITGLLLREFQRSGTISFTGFYIRRLKRIVPVALVVLGLTVLASWFLLPGQLGGIIVDALSGAFFFANWRFAFTGTDYFSQGTSVSPLQHFWSLSVEEQFYFVWPWLMLGILYLVVRMLRRSVDNATRWVGVTIVVITVASFAWAVLETISSPTVAYFSSISRTWELGVGAALAIFAGVLTRIPRPARVVMNWTGLAGIAASLFVITSDSVFPAPTAALPVLATALVVAAGIAGPIGFNPILVNPVSRYIGDISYSLYLWHWPLVVLLEVVFLERNVFYYVTVIAASVLLSVGSYHLIERPIQASPFLVRQPSAWARREAWASWARSTAPTAKIAAMISAAGLGVIFVTAGVYVNDSSIAREADAARERAAIAEAAAAEATDAPGLETEAGALQDDLLASLLTTGWPELKPSLANLLTEGHPVQEDEAGCSRVDVTDADSCTFGDPANPEIVVYGDSLGITLLPTVRAAYEADHHIRGITQPACNVLDLDVKFADAGYEAACLKIRQDAVGYINDAKPQAVLIIESYNWGNQLLNAGLDATQTQEKWNAAAESFIAKIATSGTKVVFVSPPTQANKSLTACYTTGSVPGDCISRIPPEWTILNEGEKSISGTYYVDTLHWFCYAEKCPAFSVDIPIRRDEHHTTVQYAQKVAPDFRVMLDPILSGAQAATP